MNPFERFQLRETRRQFLGRTATGIGTVALASLLNPRIWAETLNDDVWRGITNPPHFTPRAKRVIHLCMAGGPSHLETFDYKPKLAELNGQPMPDSFTQGQPIAQLQGQRIEMFRAPARLQHMR